VGTRLLVAAAFLAIVTIAGLVACGGSKQAAAGAAPLPGASNLAGIPQDGIALGKPAPALARAHEQEIAKMLYISVRTAEAHRAHIMRKLRLSTRAELVRYALQEGLLERSG
jgi:hypothetical protein